VHHYQAFEEPQAGLETFLEVSNVKCIHWRVKCIIILSFLPSWIMVVHGTIQTILLNEGIATPILVPLAREESLPRLLVQSI
jgi:hypothetical protein